MKIWDGDEIWPRAEKETVVAKKQLFEVTVMKNRTKYSSFFDHDFMFGSQISRWSVLKRVDMWKSMKKKKMKISQLGIQNF